MRAASYAPISKEQQRWLRRHVNDPYVKQAQLDGYRSRSAYKLIELNEKDRLIKPGMRIMDLGSAPGGWSQVAGKLVGAKGRVLATDILPMDPLANVDFIQGDFTERIHRRIRLLEWLGGGKFDLIISDIAPNITGIDSADQASSMYFLELALDTVSKTLKPGATFVAKMFQGAGSDAIREGTAQFVREGADPQTRGVTRAIARGLHRGERIQGLSASSSLAVECITRQW